MTLPLSIANLGAPRNATPEMMAQLRKEKARFAGIVEAREIGRLRSLADYVEEHPAEALEQASAYVHKFLESRGHVRLHHALQKWNDILHTWPLSKIISLLRETNEETRELRETSPFARPFRI